MIEHMYSMSVFYGVCVFKVFTSTLWFQHLWFLGTAELYYSPKHYGSGELSQIATRPVSRQMVYRRDGSRFQFCGREIFINDCWLWRTGLLGREGGAIGSKCPEARWLRMLWKRPLLWGIVESAVRFPISLELNLTCSKCNKNIE